MNMSPYEILIVGSLVQREAKPNDFAKVARVIYNRLAAPQRLEFDSTVNYPLDRQEVATTDADRAQVTPWNTYASMGCPPRRSARPGDEALAAAERPEPGTGCTSSRWTWTAPRRSPGLSAAPGQHRAGATQRCARLRAMNEVKSAMWFRAMNEAERNVVPRDERSEERNQDPAR